MLVESLLVRSSEPTEGERKRKKRSGEFELRRSLYKVLDGSRE